MPRRLRKTLQGAVFHVMNRAVRRTVLFDSADDYDAFIRIVRESLRRFTIHIVAYCLMPNHWHFVILCERVEEMSKWMHWVEGTHANRWNGAHGLRGTGALYQGRFKAVPVQKNRSLMRVCRYVERNALRKNLVAVAEDWAWGSLYATCRNCEVIPLSEWPILRPAEWRAIVNAPENETELEGLRRAVARNRPIGSKRWVTAVAPFVGVSLRPRGRPRKVVPKKMVPTP